MPIEVVLCKTGVGKHGPELPGMVAEVGGICSTVECFDRCEQCERAILARVDGTMTRFWTGDKLLEAVLLLASEAPSEEA